jgi:hypothetical protein
MNENVLSRNYFKMHIFIPYAALKAIAIEIPTPASSLLERRKRDLKFIFHRARGEIA